MTRDPPTLREQLPQIRRWSLLVIVSASLTLLGGWAFGAWDLPKMATYVTGNFEVDDGGRDRAERERPEWRGTRGTEVCRGCRARCSVHIEEGTLSVLSDKPASVSIWVAEHFPEHEHAWSALGCWFTNTETSQLISCTFNDVPYGIADELWGRFLSASKVDDVPRLVVTTTHAGPELALVLDEARAWGAAHPAHDDDDEGM